MKLSLIYLLSIYTVFTASTMNHEASYQWFTELADVPMVAFLVPTYSDSTPLIPAPTNTQPSAPNHPGMLQALHDAINKRPGCTK